MDTKELEKVEDFVLQTGELLLGVAVVEGFVW